jgi:Carboxypeptidase regulatory-like domain
MGRGRARTKLVFVLALASCAGWASLRAQAPGSANGTYRIAGMVVDGASGRPLGQAEVTIGLIEGKNLRQTNATGMDGRFSFEGLSAGRYQLSARRRGYVAQSYKEHDDYWSAIVVGPGLKSDEVKFAMTAGASIAGRVFDERGDALRRGTVLLLLEVSNGGRRRLTRSGSTELNDLGAYRFGHLEPGTYVVAVTARPWYAELYGVRPTAAEVRSGDIDTDVVYPVTFYPSALDAEAAGRIGLTVGESVTADVALAPTAARSVSIKSESDDPHAPAHRVLAAQYIADGISETMATIMVFPEAGSFTVNGLPPSRVDVAWIVGTGKNAQEHFKSVNLSEGDAGSASAPTVIRGVLEGVGATRVGGATVELGIDEGKKTYSAIVGAKGEFEFHEELVRGLYTIKVPQLADMQIGVRGKGLEFFDDSLEIQPGRDVELKVTAGRAARVRGRVVKNGAGAEGVFVALVPEGFEDANDLMRVGESDSSGAFEMEKIVPGKYRVIAVENAWDADWRSAEFLRRFVGRGKELEIGAGAVVTAGDVEVQEGNP